MKQTGIISRSSLAMMLVCSLGTGVASAGPVSYWAANGFTDFTKPDNGSNGEDWVGNNGFVGPGYGGQAFDAEYLYYKQVGNTLSIGLQTGFDLSDGYQKDGNLHYYAGDLALSFDNHATMGAGSGSTFEYGIDFGFKTRGYSGRHHSLTGSSTAGLIDMGTGTGTDAAGVYSVTGWSNDVVAGHHDSDPFAMDDGSLVTGLIDNLYGMEGDSHYRVVSFDLAALGLSGDLGIDAHWTMNCGNDSVDGHFSASVPEPTTLPLLGLGLLGLIAGRKKLAK